MVTLENQKQTSNKDQGSDHKRRDQRNGVHDYSPASTTSLQPNNSNLYFPINPHYLPPFASSNENFSSQSRNYKNSFTKLYSSSDHKDNTQSSGYILSPTKSFSTLPFTSSYCYSTDDEFGGRRSAPPDLDELRASKHLDLSTSLPPSHPFASRLTPVQNHSPVSSNCDALGPGTNLRLSDSSYKENPSDFAASHQRTLPPITTPFPSTFGTFHPSLRSSGLPGCRPPPPSISTHCLVVSVFSTISTSFYPIMFGSFDPSSISSSMSPLSSIHSSPNSAGFTDFKTISSSKTTLSASSANGFKSSRSKLLPGIREILFFTKVANAMAHLVPASGKMLDICKPCSNHLRHCCGQTILTMLLSRCMEEKCTSCCNPVKHCCIKTIRATLLSRSPPS